MCPRRAPPSAGLAPAAVLLAWAACAPRVSARLVVTAGPAALVGTSLEAAAYSFVAPEPDEWSVPDAPVVLTPTDEWFYGAGCPPWYLGQAEVRGAIVVQVNPRYGACSIEQHARGARIAGALAWLDFDVKALDSLPGYTVGLARHIHAASDTRALAGIGAAEITQEATRALVDALADGARVRATVSPDRTAWQRLWDSWAWVAWQVLLGLQSLEIVELALCRAYGYIRGEALRRRTVRASAGGVGGAGDGHRLGDAPLGVGLGLGGGLASDEAATSALGFALPVLFAEAFIGLERALYLAVDPLLSRGHFPWAVSVLLRGLSVPVAAWTTALFLAYFAHAAQAGGQSAPFARRATKLPLLAFATVQLVVDVGMSLSWLVGFHVYVVQAKLALGGVIVPAVLLLAVVLTERQTRRGLAAVPAPLLHELLRRLRVSAAYQAVTLGVGLAISTTAAMFNPAGSFWLFGVWFCALNKTSLVQVEAFAHPAFKTPRGPLRVAREAWRAAWRAACARCAALAGDKCGRAARRHGSDTPTATLIEGALRWVFWLAPPPTAPVEPVDPHAPAPPDAAAGVPVAAQSVQLMPVRARVRADDGGAEAAGAPPLPLPLAGGADDEPERTALPPRGQTR